MCVYESNASIGQQEMMKMKTVVSYVPLLIEEKCKSAGGDNDAARRLTWWQLWPCGVIEDTGEKDTNTFEDAKQDTTGYGRT
jgi:hypothetical protein